MWTTKYNSNQDFMSRFVDEQEYIDNEFIMIILYNFGQWLDVDNLI